MGIAKVVPWFLALLVGIAISIAGIISLASNAVLFFQGEKTTGTVSIVPGQKPSIVFTDRYASSYIKSFEHPLAFLLQDRQSVSIVYNTQNPNELSVNGFLYLWAKGVGGLLIGLALTLFAAGSIPWKNLKPTAATAQPSPSRTVQGEPKRTASSETYSSPSDVSTKQANTVNLSRELLNDAFGILKPLVDDKEVSDIILASPTAIFVKKGNTITKTDVKFPNELKYEQLIDRMLTVADNSFSLGKPIVDGMVTPLIRIHAVHKVLCEEGPYVTLRVSRFNSVRYQDLLKGTLAPREVLGYLRAMLLTGHTILIAGEVGTGKTTLIRALASTIAPSESILVIEDTPEIKIEHPAVRYIRTRESNSEGVGKVSPGECIRAGMRMAMNRIIFGEIRDPEAAESFIDVCVSGHPGMSTVHARSAMDAQSRLELLLARQQPGVERTVLREQIGSAVQVVAYTQMCRETGQRRISEVIEMRRGTTEPIDKQEIFRYNVSGDMPVWKVMNKQSFYEGDLKNFEGGYSLTGLPDWLILS